MYCMYLGKGKATRSNIVILLPGKAPHVLPPPTNHSFRSSSHPNITKCLKHACGFVVLASHFND